MKFYKEEVDGVLVSYGITPEIVGGMVEITAAEYNRIVKDRREAEEAEKKRKEEEAEAERKRREEEEQKHQQAVDEYVKKVKAGTITLDAVPEEYRAEVDAIVNPAPEPPTLKELTTQLEAAQEAIDFLMMNSITE